MHKAYVDNFAYVKSEGHYKHSSRMQSNNQILNIYFGFTQIIDSGLEPTSLRRGGSIEATIYYQYIYFLYY